MKHLLAIVLLTCAAAAQPLTEPTTAASWIWYPELPSVDGADKTRYFRRNLTLDAAPAEATIWVMGDDRVTFTVNGAPPPAPVAEGRHGWHYDLAEVLKPGDNVLAFAVYNAGGPGGLIVSGSVRDARGTVQRLDTDAVWRTAREAPEGWVAPAFDDSDWAPASQIGSAFAAPWYRHESFDLAPFIQPAEQAAYDAWRASLTALPPGLDDERDAVASLGYRDGHAVLSLDGEARPALIYRGTVDPLSEHGRRQIALFRDAGVHGYCAYYPLASCWLAPGEVDFSALDDIVRAYLSVDPEAHVVLILRLVPPAWWMEAHPDELVGYATGPIDTHDESGRVQRASLASEAWRRDMMGVWRQAIEHLEAQPWGKRIIGYQPGYGIYTEWHYFGSWQEAMPDTGPAMTAFFRDWLRERYGSDARLQQAWGDPAASLAGAEVPGVAPRRAADTLGLRDPARRRWVMDYYEAQQTITADAMAAFCAEAKALTAGRALTGAFYGYFHEVPPQTQGGHLELGRMLDSPAIDYFAAPYAYGHRLMGDDGRLRALPQAFSLADTVHMIESDLRTHLHPVEQHGRVPDEPSSIAAMRREVATALTAPAALWWTDFGPELAGGWYDDPALIAEIARLVDFAEERLARPVEPVAQVALVADPPSLYALPDGEAMRTHYQLLDSLMDELAQTGTPFDQILLSQLDQADLDRYRLLVVPDALAVDAAGRERLRAAARGRSVLWLWAPGIADGERLAPEQVADLTGFRVAAPEGGLRAVEVRGAGDDPLLARVPTIERVRLTPERETPLAAAGDAANWYNPRSEKEMREEYTAFDWSTAGDALRWAFATRIHWTDIHLRAGIDALDGLALTTATDAAATGLALRVVLKDSAGDEWVTPRLPLGPELQRHLLPLAAFGPATWRAPKGERPQLPLTGLKFVVDGRNAVNGTITLAGLAAVHGRLETDTERAYADPNGAHRVLVVDDPGATTLGTDPATGAVVLAARPGEGGRQVLSTVPYVPHELLVSLMDEAGVLRYVDSPDVVVRADSNLVCLHTNTAGTYTLRLPQPSRVTDALTGEGVGTGAEVAVPLAAPETRLLVIEAAE